jgi:hypothetical protein
MDTRSNANWLEQFKIINAALVNTQRIEIYCEYGTDSWRKNRRIYFTNTLTILFLQHQLTSTVNGIAMNFELCSVSTVGEDYVYELPPVSTNKFNMLYFNDKLGYGLTRSLLLL